MEAWATYKVCSKVARKTPEQRFCCQLWKDFTLFLEVWNDGIGATYVNSSD